MADNAATTTDHAFIRALVLAAEPGPTLPTKDGPILELYRIDFQKLPVHDNIKALMRTLMRSTAPYDKSAKSISIGDDTLGAMRQIHSNNPKYLPSLSSGKASTSRALLYQAYAQANKHHSNDRGGGATPTGYVEYTAGDKDSCHWGGKRFRIVFNYFDSLLYFSPLHYASWELKASSLNIVDKPGAFSGNPNPFFWITDVV